MEVEPTKSDCKISFRDERGVHIAGPFDGFIHLFEMDYPPSYRFWHGVAQIDCPPRKLEAILGGAPDRVAIQCTLADGRTASARWLGTEEHSGKGTIEHVQIGITGTTPMTTLDEALERFENLPDPEI